MSVPPVSTAAPVRRSNQPSADSTSLLPPLSSYSTSCSSSSSSSPPAAALPPYAAIAPTLPAFSTASSASSVTTTTPKKTVRFQTDRGDADESLSRPKPPNSLLRERHGILSSNGGSVNPRPATAGSASHAVDHTSHHHTKSHHHHHPRSDDEKVVRPTLLQPRVAVVLGLPSLWHLPLFACRLLSVFPAIWWSLGIVIRLLVQLHALALGDAGGGGAGGALSLENRLRLTETALAMIWCGVSAYLSFFFTDCLMSRWLLNYTPQATIVRLLAVSAVNGYLTSCVIYLAGGGSDARLLLPAWIGIAAILTGLYHVTQRKINIRKETSISISVFSGASFISMVSLLGQLYWDRPGYVDVPLVSLARRVCTEAARIASNVFDIDTGQML